MKITDPVDCTFQVRVPEGIGYRVLYRPGLLSAYGEICRSLITSLDSRLVVLTDERVDRLYGEVLRDSLRAARLAPRFVTVPDGETSKNLTTFERVLSQLADLRMDRHGLLVNFGGGVISDLGGFVASAYMRGIAYANFSTSMIGQLDASVGGKVAVNGCCAKNLIGAFHHPVHVAGDPGLILTLSKRDLRSGIAEAIKISIICRPELFELLDQECARLRSADPAILTKVVGIAARAKMELVSADPYEKDLRRALNFGHTLGHPIETEFSYEKVRHGEAVAVGMAVATIIARQKRVLSAGDEARIFDLLAAYDLLGCAPPIRAEAVIEHLRYIKLVRGNRLHFVLPERVGRVVMTEAIGNGELLDAFAEYEDRCAARGCREVG